MELAWNAVLTLLSAGAAGLLGIVSLVVGIAFWLMPSAWLLHWMARRSANPALGFAAAAAAVQIGAMLSAILTPLLAGALSTAAPAAGRMALWPVLMLLAFASMLVGVRSGVRGPGGVLLPWSRAAVLALPPFLLLSGLQAVAAVALLLASRAPQSPWG
ncbi:hypothetical protein [Luteimonas aquatica]|uniref:hypothetical protein n=1 Tax=Luteimonas aquatica TaxID=450364 RepID=UPI001F59F04D|nr:hypothetical protein [Luteimonas aquatica]